MAGSEALGFLADIRQRLFAVTLEDYEYQRTIEQAADLGLVGGAIYDALLGQCALKAEAEILYTWNARDFLRLPEEIASRVREPEP